MRCRSIAECQNLKSRGTHFLQPGALYRGLSVEYLPGDLIEAQDDSSVVKPVRVLLFRIFRGSSPCGILSRDDRNSVAFALHEQHR